MDESVKLLEVYTKQIEMNTKIDMLVNQIPDHETRIRKLESWRNAIPVAALFAIGSAILTIYETVHN